ncbi:hypothetical protein V6N11_024688 [Hibiscus sabdariffa]|uniref:Uncharacterized protein n=1 Tax=Hibiscus sabdariffa TaxID=183260 RepID=A0ABR2QMU6_9ROSI
MAPVSPGVVQALLTGLLHSFSSWLSSSNLPCPLLFVRVPVRHSLADKPSSVLWFFPWNFGDSRSKRAFVIPKRFLVIGLSCDNLCYGLALESIGLYCIHCWQLLYFDKSVWLPVDFVKKISKERQP